MKSEKIKNVLSYIGTSAIAVVLSLLFVNFVGQPSLVVGESMNNTLANGDLVFVEKISKNYDRYDIITFYVEDSLYIKRVIGLPGETIQIIDNEIYINDEKIDDAVNVEMNSYGIAQEPIKLADNQYFVMGDNRNNSRDSRDVNVGPVSTDIVHGRVLFGILPFKLFK